MRWPQDGERGKVFKKRRRLLLDALAFQNELDSIEDSIDYLLGREFSVVLAFEEASTNQNREPVVARSIGTLNVASRVVSNHVDRLDGLVVLRSGEEGVEHGLGILMEFRARFAIDRLSKLLATIVRVQGFETGGEGTHSQARLSESGRIREIAVGDKEFDDLLINTVEGVIRDDSVREEDVAQHLKAFSPVMRLVHHENGLNLLSKVRVAILSFRATKGQVQDVGASVEPVFVENPLGIAGPGASKPS